MFRNRSYEHRLWREARTADDLGELTAQWLERTIREHPGYPGPNGPDPETREIVGPLAALNRAGLLTTDSQPGCVEMAYGSRWTQRAAVDGYATQAMVTALYEADLGEVRVWSHPVPTNWWCRKVDHATDRPVTFVNGELYTRFGVRLSRRFLRSSIAPFAGCDYAAIDDVCTRWQVTVVDPVAGRNTMWPLLEKVALELNDNARKREDRQCKPR